MLKDVLKWKKRRLISIGVINSAVLPNHVNFPSFTTALIFSYVCIKISIQWFRYFLPSLARNKSKYHECLEWILWEQLSKGVSLHKYWSSKKINDECFFRKFWKQRNPEQNFKIKKLRKGSIFLFMCIWQLRVST